MNNFALNLKSLKRRAKDSPEVVRTAMGVALNNRASAKVEAEAGWKRPVPFRAYRANQTRFPVQVVTPPDGHYMATFFDVDPISPSGRYIAVTKVPFIWRLPYPGDAAQVVVIDLENQVASSVYCTRGWGAQLGANVQWGSDDDTLFCNDVIDGVATGVKIDRRTGRAKVLGGPVFGLSPDRSFSLSGRIDYINAGIPGYGVPESFFNRPRQPMAENSRDGIWRTDLVTGKSELLLSVKDIVSALPEQEPFKGATYYIFNIKINRQGTRGFVVLFTRGTPMRAGWPPQLATFDIDGGNVRLAMSDRLWRRGGHHPSWLPDGDHLLMNLRVDGGDMSFVRFKYDGSDLEVVAPGNRGGGHPSINPRYTHLITDAYVSEVFLDENGDVPVRCIDLSSGADSPIAKVFTGRIDGHRRVDPHPVWSRDGARVVFNGLIDRRRQVMLADTSQLCEG